MCVRAKVSRGNGGTMSNADTARRAREGITDASRARASAAQVRSADISDDTRATLGDRAVVAIGRADFAIAWDARRGGYNVSRLYGTLRINERPHGRARDAARMVTESVPAQTYGGPVRVSDPWDGTRTHARIAHMPTDAWNVERVRLAHAARIVAEREAHGGTYTPHTCPRTPRERDDSGCRCVGGGGAKHRAHGWDTPRDERTDVTRTCDARANVITDEHARTAHAIQRYLWDAAFDARMSARDA